MPDVGSRADEDLTARARIHEAAEFSEGMLGLPADDPTIPEPQTRAAMEQVPSAAPGGAGADRELRIPTSAAAARKADSDPPA